MHPKRDVSGRQYIEARRDGGMDSAEKPKMNNDHNGSTGGN
jgi:hypothetical protein